MNHRDFVDWIVDAAQLVGALGSLIAIWLAAYSVRIARHQSAESNARLIRERRIDFELDALKDLARINIRQSNASFASEEFTVLAAALGPAVVPLACAAVRLPSTPQAEDVVAQVTISSPRDQLQRQINQEILAAIQARVAERD